VHTLDKSPVHYETNTDANCTHSQVTSRVGLEPAINPTRLLLDNGRKLEYLHFSCRFYFWFILIAVDSMQPLLLFVPVGVRMSVYQQ